MRKPLISAGLGVGPGRAGVDPGTETPDFLRVESRPLGRHAALVARRSGDMFDGMGCVAAFRCRNVWIHGKRLMLIGLGGAGSAIATAMAAERPAFMRIYDLDPARCAQAKDHIEHISPSTEVQIGQPIVDGMDMLLNASPVGMLNDPNLPISASTLPPHLVVFDAITKPEDTPLLRLAIACGCTVIRGREMMNGQIAKLVDGFLDPGAVAG